jgi:hypothetical protein
MTSGSQGKTPLSKSTLLTGDRLWLWFVEGERCVWGGSRSLQSEERGKRD